jgi:hypothetical protein
MKLFLKRSPSLATCTHGVLTSDGFRGFTLEDVIRPAGEKILGATAIPPGEYSVIVTTSRRFGKDMPLLLNVPGFEGVRIHSGNTSNDTEGCILVGYACPDPNKDWIGNSRAAWADLFNRITAALAAGEGVSIQIENPPH